MNEAIRSKDAPVQRVRVVHVITGLGVAGAEIMLLRLVTTFNATIESHVICLSAEGPIADRLRAAGVSVHALGLRPGPRALLGIVPLRRLLARLQPDLVHTWLYHADLLGGLAARSLGIPVVWALHNTTLDPSQTQASQRWLVRLLARLSHRVPQRVVSCSEVGSRLHEKLGYDSRKLVVIPNGFDTEQLRPSPVLREAARRHWLATPDEIVIGHVARFHPQKDHETLIGAFGLALSREPRLRFVLVGNQVTTENTRLMHWVEAAGISHRCRLLGLRSDVQQLLPGLDLLVSSSRFGEAFPLVLGEAMASGVICVATDVGDSALIIGETGAVVPVADPPALAESIVRLAQLSEHERGEKSAAAVERIRSQFALTRIAERYADVYRSVLRLNVTR